MANTNLMESGVVGHPYFDPERPVNDLNPSPKGPYFDADTAGQTAIDPANLLERKWLSEGAALPELAIPPMLRVILQNTRGATISTLEKIRDGICAIPASEVADFGGALILTEVTAPVTEEGDSAPGAAVGLSRRTPGDTLTGIKAVSRLEEQPAEQIGQAPAHVEQSPPLAET